MKLKVDESGNVVVADGKPVYTREDGTDVPFDAPAAVAKIREISDQRDAARKSAGTAEEALKAFEGIDADAASAAIQRVADLESGELQTADQVKAMREKLAHDLAKTHDAKVEKMQEELNSREAALKAANDRLDSNLISQKFSTSSVVSTLVYPPDVAVGYWRNRFRVIDGNVVGIGEDGEPMMSAVKFGEHAPFDEALQTMVNNSPTRDQHIKAPDGRGAGAGDSGRAGQGGTHTISRESARDPQAYRAAKAAADKAGTTLTIAES